MLSAVRFVQVLPVRRVRISLLVCRSFSSEPLYADLFPAEGMFPDKKKKHRPCLIDWKSLKRYKKLHGDLLIPQSFKFGKDEEDVGHRSTTIGQHTLVLRRKYNKSITKSEPWIMELNKLGFVWNAREAQFRTLMNAILIYKEVMGDFLIPIDFQVETYNHDWPPEHWGLQIGNMYRTLLSNPLTKSRRQIMEEMGIPIAKVLPRRADKILAAIEVYKKLHNQTAETFFVPDTFVVPIYDEEWPEALWGFKLGQTLSGIRSQGNFAEYREKFVAAGVKMDPEEDVQKELERYANYRRIQAERRKALKASKMNNVATEEVNTEP